MKETAEQRTLTPRNADHPQTRMDAGSALKTRTGTERDGGGTSENVENGPETLTDRYGAGVDPQKVRERPILFSAPMIRAILAGRKTQTRRLLKPTPERTETGYWHVPWQVGGGSIMAPDATDRCLAIEAQEGLRIEAGDRLWVREAAQRLPHVWAYAADGTEIPWPARQSLQGMKRDSIPSIHLPRTASRITLEVTGVKVERLQDITDEDAIAEGVGPLCHPLGRTDLQWVGTPDVCKAPARAFADLWTGINGAGSWDANPWVVAISFRSLPTPTPEPSHDQ